jgi:hypothetical protein
MLEHLRLKCLLVVFQKKTKKNNENIVQKKLCGSGMVRGRYGVYFCASKGV